MVRSAVNFFCAAIVSLLPLLSGLAVAQEIPNYQIGDTAAQDIAAPISFTVIDLDATEALRRQVVLIVPTYFRYSPQTAVKVVAAFRKKFAADPTLPALWAQAEPEDAHADQLTAKLLIASTRHICADNLPSEFRSSPQVRLLTNAVSSLTAAEQAATEISRDQIISLERAKSDLMATFPAAQQAVAKFLAGFLKTNCALEVELSRQSRVVQAEAAISAAQYASGQFIVHRGEVITAKTKAALDKASKLIAARAAAERAQAAQQRAARKIAAGNIAAAQTGAPPNPWPWLAMLALLPLSGWMLWRRNRHRAPNLKPVKFTDVANVGEADSYSESDWQRRTLLAEQRADRAAAIVRKGLMSQLTHLLANDLVKKLVSQRTELISSQQQAASDIEVLAARLEKLEGVPAQGYYERRIAELEKELATKSAENRELLRARIEIARRQMAEAQRGVDLN